MINQNQQTKCNRLQFQFTGFFWFCKSSKEAKSRVCKRRGLHTQQNRLCFKKGGNDLAYYHDIAAAIRTQISHGKYEKNQKLPKQSELAITYKTSRVTIQKALNLLQVEGIIYAKKGTGTFVSEAYSTFDYNARVNRGLTKRLGRLAHSQAESFPLIRFWLMSKNKQN
jgi:DNA-binding transcriptional regulator YhcF (GntR family)